MSTEVQGVNYFTDKIPSAFADGLAHAAVDSIGDIAALITSMGASVISCMPNSMRKYDLSNKGCVDAYIDVILKRYKQEGCSIAHFQISTLEGNLCDHYMRAEAEGRCWVRKPKNREEMRLGNDVHYSIDTDGSARADDLLRDLGITDDGSQPPPPSNQMPAPADAPASDEGNWKDTPPHRRRNLNLTPPATYLKALSG